MARAAELMAEGRRTVTEEQLAAMTPEHWRPGLDAERKRLPSLQ